jgi:hypothetical protein
VSAASISRHLRAAGYITPAPNKRPKASYIRFAPQLPNERWQADFTHCWLADQTHVEILCWIDDHSRYALRSPRTAASPDRSSSRHSVKPLSTMTFRPPHPPTTAWSSPLACPAARAGATGWKRIAQPRSGADQLHTEPPDHLLEGGALPPNPQKAPHHRAARHHTGRTAKPDR